MKTYEGREEQFVTALLLLGTPAQLGKCLSLCHSKDARRSRYQSYRLFKLHKEKLCDHLVEADYFDVYYGHMVHGVRGEQLTEQCAQWISDFYKWILHQQKLQTYRTYKPL